MTRYINPLEERIATIRTTVNTQAEDDGLWFVAETSAEAYLQQERYGRRGCRAPVLRRDARRREGCSGSGVSSG